MPFEREEIEVWVNAGESETLELKRSTGERGEVAKSICAILKHRCRSVIIGVDPAGRVVGLEVGDQTLQRLWSIPKSDRASHDAYD